MANDTIEVAELFAGVGGFRLGLDGYSDPNHPEFKMEAAGPFKTVWANQWEPPGTESKQFAWRCYEEHFGAGSCVNTKQASETSQILTCWSADSRAKTTRSPSLSTWPRASRARRASCGGISTA